MITLAKQGDLHARRQVLRRIRNPVVVSKLFDEVGPAFADRNGGYTRVLKVGPRRGDSVEVCLVQLVGDEFRSDDAQPAEAAEEGGAAAGEDVEAGEAAGAADKAGNQAATGSGENKHT